MMPFADGADVLGAGSAAAGLYQAGDTLGAGVVVVDTALRVVRVNRWIEAAAGRASSTFVGMPLADAFTGLGGTAREAAFRRALGGETVVFAHRFHHYLIPLPNPLPGAGYPLMQQSARILPIQEPGGVTGALAIIQDVSERVAREDELRRAKEEAESASRAKSDFLAAISHELRTPLSAVIGYADLIRLDRKGTLSPAQSGFLDRIGSSAWHLVGIIDEILTFSRVEAGRQPLEVSDVDVPGVIDDAIMMLKPLADTKSVQLFTQMPPGPVCVRSDLRLLKQILINLVGNSVKFTDSGSVQVLLERDGDDVLVHVRDTGPGIPAGSLSAIFDPFTQVDQTATRAKGGTGLGLPVSRRLAELLGGRLTVESTVDVGSTFTLRIPHVAPDTQRLDDTMGQG